ncbi:MAG: hypothetical protein IT236_07510 [Bacteroidia bacterium]|nr:hypothetical protein [Bacteroidia bacterium]
MDILNLLKDKSLKSKQKTEALAQRLLSGDLKPQELIAFASAAKDPDKATCIEAFEAATKTNATTIASEKLLAFVTESLTSKAPRVKWESAKVIGNIAALYPKKLDKAIVNLLNNTEDKGTVVRWAAAFALGEILKLKTPHNKELLPAVNNIVECEENNGVKKHYLTAIKKLAKA